MLRPFHAKKNQGRLNRFLHTWRIFPHEKSRGPPPTDAKELDLSPRQKQMGGISKEAAHPSSSPPPPPTPQTSVAVCLHEETGLCQPPSQNQIIFTYMCKYCTALCARAQCTACHELGRAKIASGIFSHIFFLFWIYHRTSLFLPSITIRR